MNLYITDKPVEPLQGVVISASHIGLNLAHLTIASRMWDTAYVDVDECIPEGALRFLHTKCKSIRVLCPEHPSMHQTHLLIELYPELGGRLRRAQLKGEGLSGILPEMWEYGKDA